jgi:hypothetical protein
MRVKLSNGKNVNVVVAHENVNEYYTEEKMVLWV